jgi:phosphoserine phosphatase
VTLRLAIFDVDGTLKQTRDPYVYLHEQLGTLEASQPFFAKAMAGELDYEEWLRLDVALWRGVSRAQMEALFRQVPYVPGARETVRALRRAGVRIALVSTGVNVHAELVQDELVADRVFANEILFEGGVATGEARLRVPEGGKRQIVARLQAEFGVGPETCLAVGDGASDADMFPLVHVGVAVSPSSDGVRAAAHLILDEPDLGPLLPSLREHWPGWIAVE